MRIAFGAMLFVSTIRFILKGWIGDFYVTPKYHFPFFGFEWLPVMSATAMYTIYTCMSIAALLICLGLFYRAATITLFICFSYVEMLDKTYYLNHYYLVTVISFLLIFVPAQRCYSLDVLRKPSLRAAHVPSWMIQIFKYQLCIVYLYAGLSKLTSDWLVKAMPLKLWLLAKTSTPVIGYFFQFQFTAYFFSWAGALFDLSIPFLLLNKRTRPYAYVIVIIFHILTAVLFQIGMFPYFMIAATLIFFSEDFYIKMVRKVSSSLHIKTQQQSFSVFNLHPVKQKLIALILCIHFLFQILIPLRYLLYRGNLLWTEEGYRFSWRVMLMEKSGTAYFYVKDPSANKKFEVNNSDFLTPYQERMMETQPDMMLQYAHILKNYYAQLGINDAVVTTESYVSLNGTGSHLYIDSSVNLADEHETMFGHKAWILSYNHK